MDRLGPGRLGGEQDRGGIEVASGCRRGPDAYCDVGLADMRGVAIRLRMNCDRLQAEQPAGPLDPQRNLPAIGDENLGEHPCHSSRRSGWPAWTSSPDATSTAV